MELPQTLEQLIFNYWNINQLGVNFLIFFNLLGALILGMILGLERTMQGRAAGIRTYGIVAMGACALTVFTGYPNYWFGGSFEFVLPPDPGRVIQGIIAGVGFLCAGVIIKDGFSISGLSTAASIWLCSAIGILVGVGFYGGAISLTFFAMLTMYFVSHIEAKLPQINSYYVEIKFKEGFIPEENKIRQKSEELGLIIKRNGIAVAMKDKIQTWKFVCNSIPGKQVQITNVTAYMSQIDGIKEFDISKTRL